MGVAIGPPRTKVPKSRLKNREASFEDYPQIAALQVQNGLATRSYEDWVSLWKWNPVYKQLGGRTPIGWVLQKEGGQIVGSIANIPLAYHFGGRELYAAAAGGWVVDSGYRGHSMSLLASFTRQKDVDLFVSTTVSSRSEPALRLFQWSKAPVGNWRKSAFWITDYQGFAKSVLNMKSVPLADAVSYPVSAALFCRDKLKDGRQRMNRAFSEVELCPDFDSRFDEFWEELKHQNRNILLAHRDRDTLSWHFRYSKMRRSLWILTAAKGSRLVAYAVFDRQDNIVSGLKRVRLVDFQALQGSEKVLSSALYWMLNKCRQEGIHILENVGCWLERPGLPPIPEPDHRTLPASIFYYKANDKDLSETLKSPAIWAPSSFDGDASL
jgi:hypothetical protein